jgi:hypothetical protein
MLGSAKSVDIWYVAHIRGVHIFMLIYLYASYSAVCILYLL